MVSRRFRARLALFMLALMARGIALGQAPGGIRGKVFDQDFDMPLGGADAVIAETGQRAQVTEDGLFVFETVAPGVYTIVFSKEGYSRRVKSGVVVNSGQMTEVEAALYGEFTELDEFVVQEIDAGGGAELALLTLRLESPALLDSISSDIMSQAGASDAAAALNLVTGASVADGKFAVIRGLPDRYVNSQINGVRMPTADPDKRAVELDLFPASAIETMQVSKTFTPDQQGDASGGAVNIVLKKIPDENTFKFGASGSYNSQVTGQDDFLSYKDGPPNYLGMNDDRDIPDGNSLDAWKAPVGSTEGDAPTDYKWNFMAGGKRDLGAAWKLGGLVSAFHENDSSFYKDGIDDKYWVESPGARMTPQTSQGTPEQGDFKSSLFDVQRAGEEVKWGVLGALGIESENHSVSLTYLYTRVAENIATLAENTRGKAYYFPGYDPDDAEGPGNQQRDASPYLRLETLEYTERTASTLQLHGEHKLPFPEPALGKILQVLKPEVSWTLAHSTADLLQPDKRQFGELWYGPTYNRGFPPYIPPFTSPANHRPFKPGANFTLGNLQRVWKEINEESDQYSLNLKLPFKQWTGDEGYFKFGKFHDQVTRLYNQDSFSNFNDNGAELEGPWEDHWSEVFPDENHPMSPGDIDVDYEGHQVIDAWYYMADIPLTSWLRIIGGVRHEKTELSIVNTPEKDVTWIPPGAPGQVQLNPGDADVAFRREDALPSIGLVLTPLKQLKLHASYSETVARQTFKELTPIQQQEYLGGDVFIGNPALQMSSVKNYDLRADWTPFEGSLASVSYFKKDITFPIEYVQRITEFDYTTPVNYPEGTLSGFEFELRQEMGRLWNPLEGLTLGGNLTLIDSEVTLPDDEAAAFEEQNIRAPIKSRDMTNAPEYLYNLYFTYDLTKVKLPGTKVSVFYTVRGDTLVAGAGQSQGNFIPDVYETEYGTLNVSLVKEIGKNLSVQLQAKNLLNPDIETVYRSKYIGEDVTKTSYKKGIEVSLGFTYSITRDSGKKSEEWPKPDAQGDSKDSKKNPKPDGAKDSKKEPKKAEPAVDPAAPKANEPSGETGETHKDEPAGGSMELHNGEPAADTEKESLIQ